jgi:hypothetical protein
MGLLFAACFRAGARCARRGYLHRWPVRDLNVEGETGCSDAEEISRVVVPRRCWDTCVDVLGIEGLRLAAESIDFTGDPEVPVGTDVPTQNVDPDMAGSRSAAPNRMTAKRELCISPRCRSGSVKLSPTPLSSWAAKCRAGIRLWVGAVLREADLPHLMRGTTAVRARRRSRHGCQRSARQTRRNKDFETPHALPFLPPRAELARFGRSVLVDLAIRAAPSQEGPYKRQRRSA